MVELCKDRLDLLVDDKVPKYTCWHARKVGGGVMPKHVAGYNKHAMCYHHTTS